jgi:hypothetical protein
MRQLQDHAKVFGIGLSKTATASLSEALNVLGIPSVHFPHDAQTFAELQRGEYRLSILREYQAVTDTPVAPFFAQLDRTWPGSKFILTVRDRETWLSSAEAHWRKLRDESEAGDAQQQAFTDFINACVYGCTHFNADRFSWVYDTHLRNASDYFADRPDDFLILDIVGGDGWEKLCDFLDRPAPDDTPFPHHHRNVSLPIQRWERKTREASQDLDGCVAAGQTLILVDDQRLDSDFATGRRVLPLPERDGHFSGLPARDEEAIASLERLRHEQRAGFLVVAWPAFWWLDHYRHFAAYVRERYPCVFEGERLVIFDLR